MASAHRGKSNWLLRALIAISLGIHVLVFMHVAGIYRSSALTYIELTMREISKPRSRAIPRPRVRPKIPPQPRDMPGLDVRRSVIPSPRPMKIDPVQEQIADRLVEKVTLPDIPQMEGAKIAAWDPGPQLATSENVNSNDYLEMVRLRIESHKKYPESARRRRIEGRTTVRFTIKLDGRVSDVKVVRRAKSTALNRAAVLAVKGSSPFPKPPGRLFNGPISLEVTVVFELT